MGERTDDQPAISLVLCTRNRASALAETLGHLMACRIPEGAKVEFVLVDNNSTDSTRTVIEDFVGRCPTPAFYVFEGRQGVSAARNAGCRKARGAIVAMIDDDVIPHQDFFRQVRDEFGRAQGECVIGGRVELWNAMHAPVTIKTNMNEERLSDRDPASFHILGCSMSFHRSIFDKLAGFDEAFGPGTRLHAGDETDFYHRAFRAGCAIIYSPRIVVYHNHGRTESDQIRRLMQGYYIAGGAFYAKHLLAGNRVAAKMLYYEILYSLNSIVRGKPNANETLSGFLFRMRNYAVGVWRYALRRA